MKLDKPTLALSLAAVATIVFIAVTVFPNNIIEVFSGSVLALLLFQENEQFKLTKKRERKNNEQ